MQRDCGQAAVPADFLLLPPHGVHELSPGASMIQTHCRDLAPLPVQHDNPGDPKEQDTEEPKKRKGGWPKGKKRKPPRALSVPRAPTTGYVIFLNEQRSQLRARHPDLPFTEITKMLAAQWAQLSQEKKQGYVYEADKDKQRYIRELQAYQSSEAYRAFLRRQAAHKAQALCGAGTLGSVFESEGLDFSAIHGDENKDLYCRTCRQFFSSLHNKKEHLLGKQHLQNLTVKEFELRELKRTLERAQAEQEALQSQLAEFQNRQQRLEVELAGLKTYGIILEKEFENLDMLLMLSHFGLQVVNTA